MALLSAIARIHSGALQPPIAFEIVSNDREMNLEFGLGQAQPSHATKRIAALPGPEDFFNSRPDRPQRTIMRFERFGWQPAMALAQKPRRSARGDDGLFDQQRIIGAIGINLSGLPRDDRRRDRDIGLIGRRGLNFADDARVLIGGDMRL